MTDTQYTKEQLMAVARDMGDDAARLLAEIIARLSINEEPAEQIKPINVPTNFKRIAVDHLGYNIGQYVFGNGDKHVWLPPEEACKERPDISKGILHKDVI